MDAETLTPKAWMKKANSTRQDQCWHVGISAWTHSQQSACQQSMVCDLFIGLAIEPEFYRIETWKSWTLGLDDHFVELRAIDSAIFVDLCCVALSQEILGVS